MNTTNSIIPEKKLNSEVEIKELVICFILALYFSVVISLAIFDLSLILAR
jgi:hypothetical protein